MAVTIRLFGPPEILVEGEPLVVDTRKAIGIVAFLAASGSPQPRATLLGMLWPELDEIHARGALRRTLSTLRRGLGRGLHTDRDSVSLDPTISIDLDEFRAAINSVGAHGHADHEVCSKCVAPLRAAAAAARGDFLAGFFIREAPEFELWQLQHAATLRRSIDRVLDKLSVAESLNGDYAAAVIAAQRRLGFDPLNESAHRQLMLLFAWSGDRSSALREYRDCVAMLDRELGVEPLPETADLAEAITLDDLPPPPSRRRPIITRLEPPSAPASFTAPFVGRDGEFATLLGVATSQRPTPIALVEGPAGIGRSRLLEELRTRLEESGRASVVVGAHPSEVTVPYALISDVLRKLVNRPHFSSILESINRPSLRQASELVPALLPGRSSPSKPGPAARARFLLGVSEVLAACFRQIPLLIDDIHLADPASLELLAFLLRRGDELPVTLITTRRPDSSIPLPQWEQAIREERITRLTLQPLRQDELVAMVRAALPSSIDASSTAARLLERSGGIPMFITAYLEAMRGDPDSLSGLPMEVQRLLEGRIGTLSGATRQVLTAAAVVGSPFDFETVRAVAGRSADESVTALEQLLAEGLIREESPGGSFSFAHALSAETAYLKVPLVRRRLLHSRAADSLIPRMSTDPALAAAIARHLERAGRAREGADFHMQAADRARALHANADALEHLDAALALGHPEAPRIHEITGELHALAGRYGRAIAEFRAAAAVGGPSQALEQKLGRVYLRAGKWDLAAFHLGNAAGPDQASTRRLSLDRGLLALRLGQFSQAESCAAEALGSPDPVERAAAENLLGIVINRAGAPEDAIPHFQTALDNAITLGEDELALAARNNLGLALAGAKRQEDAITTTRLALESAQRIGDRHAEAAITSNLADHFNATGRHEQAMGALKAAVAIFAEIGTEPGAMEPEIWKLTEW